MVTQASLAVNFLWIFDSRNSSIFQSEMIAVFCPLSHDRKGLRESTLYNFSHRNLKDGFFCTLYLALIVTNREQIKVPYM